MIPPCKRDGIDCERRHVGCQKTCPDMKVAQLMHMVELQEKKKLQEQHDTTARSVERMRRRKK